MMTQNVKAQVIDLLSNVTASKSSATKQKSTGNEFSSVMDSKSSSVDERGNSSNNNKKVTEDTGLTGAKQNTDKEAKTVKKDSNSSVTDKVTEASDNQEVDGIEDESRDLTASSKRIEELLAMLQNTVESSLGITKEELEKAMEALGISTLDLLNTDNLKQLVLQVNGADDISAVLTDENLENSLKQLIQAVDNLQLEQNAQISREDLTVFLSQYQNKKADTDGTRPVQLNTAQEVSEEGLNSTSANQQSDITLEIHKIGDTEVKENNLNTSDSGTSDSNTSDSNNKEANAKTPSSVETFIQNLAVKGNENNLNFTEQIANVRQMQEITNQILEQIKIVIKPGQTSMELQLNPESLGKINLTVVSKDGVVTAQFTTQDMLAKEAIESHIQVLRDNLNNQGLKVESIEVTVSNFSFAQSNQASGGDGREQQGHSQKQHIIEAESNIYSNSAEDAISVMGTINQNGSSIDYTA